MALWGTPSCWAARSGWLLPLLACVLCWSQVGCGSGRDMSDAHGSLRAPSDCVRCHQDSKGRTPTSPAKCLECHAEIGSRRAAHRGLHGLDIDRSPRSGSQVRRAGLCPDVAKEPPDFAQLCGNCHHEHAGTVLVTWGSLEGCDPPEKFRERHAEGTGFALHGKHATTDCGKCHKELLPSGQRTFLTAPTDCQGCHAPISSHGPLRDNRCQRCHTDADWKQRLPFDHRKETKYPLEGQHQKVDCSGCHKDLKFGMSVEQYADCSPCHEKKNPHGVRFKGQLQCSFCHTPDEWEKSVFEHGKRTRFPLTGGHAAPTFKACRGCHRGKDKSDFEDLRGLVTGKAPATFSSVNCVGCHQHTQAHGGNVKVSQCLLCHDPGRQPLKQNLNINKMTYVGHRPDSDFPLTGGHDLTKLKDVSYCKACHKNVAQGFYKLSKDCYSCHQKTDQQRGHRGKLGKQCKDCHDPDTGTWINTERFKHEQFPLEGAHLRPTACDKCHKGASRATAFKPRSAPIRNCGDVECHKRNVNTSKHGDKYGGFCGGPDGCHSPTHGRFLDPKTWEGHTRE